MRTIRLMLPSTATTTAPTFKRTRKILIIFRKNFYIPLLNYFRKKFHLPILNIFLKNFFFIEQCWIIFKKFFIYQFWIIFWKIFYILILNYFDQNFEFQNLKSITPWGSKGTRKFILSCTWYCLCLYFFDPKPQKSKNDFHFDS